jgi:hypothetical protein
LMNPLMAAPTLENRILTAYRIFTQAGSVPAD